MSNRRLRQLQLLQLKILKEVKRVCDSNNIPYWLDAGTLLGAVRHKGAIPWDDDLDIGLLESDYRRLKALVLEGELGEDFFWEDWETDPFYGFPYAKICLQGTEYVEEKNRKSSARRAIFIDVFPYYPCAPTAKERAWESKKLKVLTHLLLCKMKYEVWAGEGIGKILKFLPIRICSHFTDVKRIRKDMMKIFRRHYGEAVQEIYVGDGQCGARWLFPKQWFETLIDMQYEDGLYKVPEKYKDYLTKVYGDYQIIPDEKKRECHNILSLDLGKYEI
ncbi:LicD family protein [Lachnotalea sp. AF33-28]|uniref:LicD family protein n=1 Tax=Lachnotalea sp. AF33-28 TaxID=2292046 RepID=UPI000E4B6DA6|nr:LicD family protein [Lachnotalea sp. AF33-28]RHP35460.1 LicD family protein [Lachnotalea sp. AF33-28]